MMGTRKEKTRLQISFGSAAIAVDFGVASMVEPCSELQLCRYERMGGESMRSESSENNNYPCLETNDIKHVRLRRRLCGFNFVCFLAA